MEHFKTEYNLGTFGFCFEFSIKLEPNVSEIKMAI